MAVAPYRSVGSGLKPDHTERYGAANSPVPPQASMAQNSISLIVILFSTTVQWFDEPIALVFGTADDDGFFPCF